MKIHVAIILAGSCALSTGVCTEVSPQTVRLPTSKTLQLPVPGFVSRTNGYPAAIALSPDGRYAALLNEGFGTEESGVRQSIAILDLSNNQLHDFPDDRVGYRQKQSYFIGLAFSTDGTRLYASMSSISDGGIAVYRFKEGALTPERFIKIEAQPLAPGKTLTYNAGDTAAGFAPAYPAGIAVLPSATGDRLLVANNLADSLILIGGTSGEVLQTIDLSVGPHIPTSYPYTVIADRSGTKAWVSLWNGSAVAQVDLVTGKIARRISLGRPADAVAPGTHPAAMLLNRSEDVLYVATANSGTAAADGVAAVNLDTGALLGCYCMRLAKDASVGTAPLAIALSPDQDLLYVASASLDAVAVFKVIRDERRSPGARVQSPLGFIPTEWYPSALAVARTDLLIANAKGQGSGPNSMKAIVPQSASFTEHPYIGARLGGSLQRLSLDEIAKNLTTYTRRVEEDNLIRASAGKIEFAGGRNPIHHVIYILKENRTYDQILGDLPVGDADPSLTMYGADVTPNIHRLALEFGVLDNFYDSGDVSANGHLWSDGSATSDYIEKAWPPIYRFSERPDDFGNALEQGIPDPDDPGTGFLWDELASHKFSYRIYGEMLSGSWCKDERIAVTQPSAPSAASAGCSSKDIKPGEALPANVGSPPGGPSPWPWPVPRLERVSPTKKAQRGHFDPNFADFNIDYPDQLRADEFLREFRQFDAARGGTKQLPQFILLWLPNDHTGGTRAGKPTPRASVADNDLAVGRVVDAVSHSRYWDDTAIFVVEDDAQDGADHVDAHRSVALVISKYSPTAAKPFVDHHFYTTVSMVHTMEALLGLPPMNLFDAHAPLMAAPFSGPGNHPPYQVDESALRSGLLYQTNSQTAPGSKESEAMDFSGPDKADARVLNAILWDDAKGSLIKPPSR
jgi:DNA-binding beta-propeller fold protein YncE